MKTLTLKTVAALLLVLPMGAMAQIATNTTFTSVNTAIPEGNPTGLASSTDLSGISGFVSSVTVSLDITGGFNGDLYAYLSGPTGGFAVLLNRTGVTSGNSFGYSDPGLDVTFADGNPDIHDYQVEGASYNGSGQLTGTWAPDGRNIDPQSSPATFDTAGTGADLSTFNGLGPNGTWTLFVADLSSGSQGTLVSWGLSVVTVPEPQTWILVAGGVGVLLMLNRGRKL